MLAIVVGSVFSSCDDEENYSPATGQLVGSVTTGEATVTANSATLNGTFSGDLSSQSAARLSAGFNFGDSENALVATIGSIDGNSITLPLEGLVTNKTYYYQAFLTLQGKVTYSGEIKSFTTTDASVSTVAATATSSFAATLGGKVTNLPAGATVGVKVSSKQGQSERGVNYTVAEPKDDFSVTVSGFMPGITYYYRPYVNIGSGIVYGEEQSFTTSDFKLNVDEDLVDLGLSTKWCKYNIGASKPSEMGGLFGFGDVAGFNTSTSADDYSSSDIYKTNNDVCYISLGKATLPSAAEWEELFQLCKKEWKQVDGVYGYEFTGPNGNSIFLPAAGSRNGDAVSGEGETGVYLTGSISSADGYCDAYSFSANGAGKTVSPTFVALSVRPVSTAKIVKLDKSLICNTWFIDIKPDGSHVTFPSPMYYYGTDDSWATVSNTEPIIGDTWSWQLDYAGNTWVCEAKNYGCMTFNEDGTVVIKRADSEEETGTYTVDEDNKTITLSIDVLSLSNFDDAVTNRKTELKIMSLTENSLQIGVLRDENPCTLVFNYVPDSEYNGFEAKLTCYSNAEGDVSDAWASASKMIVPKDGGQYTLKFTTTNPRSRGSVYLIDIVGLAQKYPNSFVKIDNIKKDGVDLPFDASRFFYGDIEGNGNYRIELANIWGAGHNDGWNGIADNPFTTAGGEAGDNGPAELAFNESFEVTFTIVSLSTNYAGSYDVNLITINPDWGGTWGTKAGSIDVKFEGNKYFIEPTTIDFTYTDAYTNYSAGSIMTFFQVENFPFMQPDVTFNGIEIDGTALTGYDASKVINSSEGANYRYELWNCYGATGSAGCAFGTRDGDVIKELGFSSSLKISFTVNSLFPKVK